jgi:hypothetical protein
VRGGEGGAKSYDGKKAWPCIDNSILSGEMSTIKRGGGVPVTEYHLSMSSSLFQSKQRRQKIYLRVSLICSAPPAFFVLNKTVDPQ